MTHQAEGGPEEGGLPVNVEPSSSISSELNEELFDGQLRDLEDTGRHEDKENASDDPLLKLPEPAEETQDEPAKKRRGRPKAKPAEKETEQRKEANDKQQSEAAPGELTQNKAKDKRPQVKTAGKQPKGTAIRSKK